MTEIKIAQPTPSATEIDFKKCLLFLQEIGIETGFEKIGEPCFLPGLSIRNGKIIIDREALKYPGDILHEAGHIAVLPMEERRNLNAAMIGSRAHHKAEEMMAIAWSYAACVHLGIDPGFVFHDEGYSGDATYIIDWFKNEQYFGLPMLQWKGMAADKQQAAGLKVDPYPAMIKWTLD